MLEYGIIYREHLQREVFLRFGPDFPGLRLKDVRLGLNTTRKFVLLLLRCEHPEHPGQWFVSDTDRGNYESMIAGSGFRLGTQLTAINLERRGYWRPADEIVLDGWAPESQT